MQIPNQPLVSVIITVFNYGRYVGEAIRSIKAQTMNNFECIIVDDGSTDNTKAVVENEIINDFRFRYVFQTNQGVAASRTHGIRLSRGLFCVCLDADDKLAPTFLEVLASAMKKDRGLGIAYTGLMLMDSKGGFRVNYDWPPEFDWNIQSTPHVPPNNCIPSACMFRKEMWERAGGHKQVYAPGEDTEFWTRGLSVGFRAKRVTNEPLFWYRWHKDSASNTKPYVPIDTWLPWMRDKDFPFGAPVKEIQFVRSYAFPVVSVIIPVGPGHEQYLSGALDSLLGQTLRDWECIVINDTGIPIQNWELPQDILSIYPFVKWVETTGKCGAGSARNSGVAYASAPLLFFLDADDHILPNALELIVEKYANNEDGRYVYTDWLAIDSNKKITRMVSSEYDPHLWYEKMLHPVSILMPVEDFYEVGGFDETLVGWEDWDFFVKCAIQGKHGVRLPEPLLVYYTNTGMRSNEAFRNSDTISAELNKRYGNYLRGEKQMVSCCGGGAPSILAAKRAMGLVARESQENTSQSVQVTSAEAGGKVRMEFIGIQRGSMPFMKGKYRAGNNAMNKYIDADPQDVEFLEMSGMFRKVVRKVEVPQRELPKFEDRIFVEPAKPEPTPDPVGEVEDEELPVVVTKEVVKPSMTLAQLTREIEKGATKERLLYWLAEEQRLDKPRKLAVERLEKAIDKLLG